MHGLNPLNWKFANSSQQTQEENPQALPIQKEPVVKKGTRVKRSKNLKNVGKRDLLKRPIDLDWVKRRFITQIEATGDGCRTWKGEVDSKGLPLVNYYGINTTARRMAWLINNPNILPPKSLGMTCGKQLCVRYEHIFVKGHTWSPKHMNANDSGSTKSAPTIESLVKEIGELRNQISAQKESDSGAGAYLQRKRDILEQIEAVFHNLGQIYQMPTQEIRSMIFSAYGYSKQGK